MGIYRGTGGTGDSTTDATITEVTQQAVNAATSATDAASSASSASSSASGAATSATSAASSASLAATKATTATTNAINAALSETAAELSETNSATSETNAASSATNAASSATTASTAASNASTSETNAATSASTATTQASTATTQATTATTQASAAAVSATAAQSSEDDAATSETNAATSETNASSSETNAASSASSASSSASTATSQASTATTKASEASTSATNAASSATSAASSASTATTQASTATTKASEASTSESNAATSESNAATSATNAATQATSASNSAASAASALDSFDDRYLGSKAAAPSTDNDGNALIEGALYFDSTDNGMQVYDGADWIAASSSGNISFLKYKYVATSNQTTFSGSDANNATLSYTVGNIVVMLNGIVLDASDITATNGTSIVLASGASTGDELTVRAYKSFTTADMVPASTGGTFGGDVDVSGTITADGLSVDGNVGIGTSSPSTRLTTVCTSDSVGVSAQTTTTGSYIGFKDATSSNWYYNTIGAVGDNLKLTTSGVERLRVDSSGNLGIGTSSPARALSTKSSSVTVANFESTSSTAGLISFSDANTTNDVTVRAGAVGDNLVLQSGGSERLRVDSSGRVLMGMSSSSGTVAGFRVIPNDFMSFTTTSNDAGDRALLLNRQSSDGMHIEFKKANSSVGSIGVDNGDNLTISGNSSHAGLQFGNSAVYPHKNGANVDATVDLGESTLRFKDAYLSGNVQLGTSNTYATIEGKASSDLEIVANAGQINGNPNIIFKSSNAGSSVAERMRIDSAGRVTMPYQPAFGGKNTTSSTISSGNVFKLNSMECNVGNHYSTSTGRFTAPVAGQYLFSGTWMSSQPDSGYSYMKLRKNGGTVASSYTTKYDTNCSISIILTLAAGDYVDPYIDTGSFYQYDSYHSYCGHLIG